MNTKIWKDIKLFSFFSLAFAIFYLTIITTTMFDISEEIKLVSCHIQTA